MTGVSILGPLGPSVVDDNFISKPRFIILVFRTSYSSSSTFRCNTA
jgi:hypothetical protein